MKTKITILTFVCGFAAMLAFAQNSDDNGGQTLGASAGNANNPINSRPRLNHTGSLQPTNPENGFVQGGITNGFGANGSTNGFTARGMTNGFNGDGMTNRFGGTGETNNVAGSGYAHTNMSGVHGIYTNTNPYNRYATYTNPYSTYTNPYSTYTNPYSVSTNQHSNDRNPYPVDPRAMSGIRTNTNY